MVFGKKDQLFGLDIGSSSLKMAEIRKTGKGYQLLNGGMVPLAPEAIVEGAIMNAQAVVEGILQLLEKHSPTARNVATAVSGHSVIIKKISLPWMTREELDQSIQWEAEQYIPFNIQDVNLDYQILGDKPKDAAAGGKDEMEVLLVAAKKDLVEDYTALLHEADLHPVVMDVACFAVENMYEINNDLDEGEVVALFNVGASITNVNVFRKNGSLFTRDIHFGGNQFNEEIQKTIHVSFEEAEKLKLASGKVGGGVPAVVAVIEQVTDALLNELQRSMEFFLASSGGEKIDRVVLSGGGAMLSGLTTKMQERLGTPVELCDPFQRIDLDQVTLETKTLRQIAPLMGVSVGLAVRGVED